MARERAIVALLYSHYVITRTRVTWQMAAKMAGSISGFLCLGATRREDAPASEQGAIYGDIFSPADSQAASLRFDNRSIDRSMSDER